MTISPSTTLPEEVFSTPQPEDTCGLLFDRFTDEEASDSDELAVRLFDPGLLDQAAYAEVLPAEVIYHTYVERLPAARLTQEQEDALIAQARAGDRAARDALIASCQRYIRYYAGKYARLHYALAGNRRIEFLDLVQEANAAILTHVERALTRQAPCGYLRVIIRHAMVNWCIGNANAVQDPAERKVTLVPVYSLDAPVPGTHDRRDEQTTFAELLATPISASEPQAPPKDYTTLYRALERLTPNQRDTILRHFGLQGQPEEPSSAISPHARDDRRNALKRLRDLLTSPEVAQAPVETLGTAFTATGEMYTTDQVCDVLGIGRSTLCRLVRRGTLTRCVTGYYRKQEVDALVEQRPKPCPEAVYTLRETCAILGLGKSTVCSLARQGKLARPVTGHYARCDVDRYAALVRAAAA